MKKILVIHTKYRELGGEDIAIQNEIGFLKEFYEVEELFFNNEINNFFQQGISFITNHNQHSVNKLNEVLKDFSPDIAYVHNTWFKGSLGIFKALEKKNIQTVLKLHNFRYDCTRSLFSKNHFRGKDFCNACGIKRKDMGIFNKYFLNSILKSIFITRYGIKYFDILKMNKLNILVLTHFHKNYLKNILQNKKLIDVFPNYIYTDNNLNITEKENYVVYAGRISEEKGVKELIESFKKAKLNNISLKIVGNGPQLNNLRKIFIDTNIEFLGQKNNSEVLKIISKARAVITGTKLYEGQPTLLCEASSMGVVSFYPRTGGISEFFPENYLFSYEQFNYEDLTEKLSLLHDKEKIEKTEIEIKEYIMNYLGKENLLMQFENALNNEK
ncbi:glycosyltransferase family 4 protein [Acidimicrobiaceae bacterium]|nr:glycosyltransferase family 4 protein [Acidimicrobiaceae bacterium]